MTIVFGTLQRGVNVEPYTVNVPVDAAHAGKTMVLLVATNYVMTTFVTPSGWTLAHGGAAERAILTKTHLGASEPAQVTINWADGYNRNIAAIPLILPTGATIAATTGGWANSTGGNWAGAGTVAGDLTVCLALFNASLTLTDQGGTLIDSLTGLNPTVALLMGDDPLDVGVSAGSIASWATLGLSGVTTEEPHAASGGSTANVTASPEGSGTKQAAGAAQASTIVLSVTEGAGAKQTTGSSQADVQVAVQGSGAKAAGGGTAPVTAVAVSGTGVKAASSGAEAGVDVVATGGGAAAQGVAGGSTATVGVTSSGAGTKHAQGSSDANIFVVPSGDGEGIPQQSGGATPTVEVVPTGAGSTTRSGGATALVSVVSTGGTEVSAGSSLQGWGQKPPFTLPEGTTRSPVIDDTGHKPVRAKGTWGTHQGHPQIEKQQDQHQFDWPEW